MKSLLYKSLSFLSIGVFLLCIGCNGREKALRHTLDSLQELYNITEEKVNKLKAEESEQNELDSLSHENKLKIKPTDFIERSSADSYWSIPNVGAKLKNLGFKKISSKTIDYDSFSERITDMYSEPYAEKTVYSRDRNGKTEKVVLNYYSFIDGDEGFSFLIEFPDEDAKNNFIKELLSMPDVIEDGSKIKIGFSYAGVLADISKPLKIEIYDGYSVSMPR